MKIRRIAAHRPPRDQAGTGADQCPRLLSAHARVRGYVLLAVG
jgi:hypothetical protein